VKRLSLVLSAALMAVTLVVILGGAGAIYLINHYDGGLPDHRQLADYEPPTATRVHAGDGRLLAEYARQNRTFVPVEAIPERVKQAFVAAEDQHFYDHPGIDVFGIGRAILSNLERAGTNRRPEGASTITQQVAKNFLLSSELSYQRKLKEIVLALRIERTFSKDRILELYLNEIFLGNRSYGVAAAALNYFDKSLDELTIAEAALLAGLPKAPSTYDPAQNPDAARQRRDYVLTRMQADGYITPAEAALARAEPIALRRRTATQTAEADFFIEEVRRQLVARLGEEGFYEGGLSVRVTLSPDLQAAADRSLRHGLATYDRRQGWRGPWGQLDLAAAGDAWLEQLQALDPGFELGTWRRGVVLAAKGGRTEIGLDDGERVRLSGDDVSWTRRQPLAAGDAVVMEPLDGPEGRRWVLRQRPGVEGAVVALDPHTGRVLAMSGGFSYRQSKFNRATQAHRQPGSSFKPFVYLAALEAGMTPVSMMLDAPISLSQGAGLARWEPENFSNDFLGPITLRVGLERSRNLVSVRVAQKVGMDHIIELARRLGLGSQLQRNLAASLGSNEVTPIELAGAYAELVNGGHKIDPVLVERIQDRHGRTIMRADPRPCEGCTVAAWDGSLPPGIPNTRPIVVDPRHAYQMVSMLEGVVQRGTATDALDLGKPLAGKTGTTNDNKDTWFVGFSPDLVVAVWVGFDQPKSMGRRATGASVALPIWIDVMRDALADRPATPFRTPPGLSIVRVNATSGKLASGGKNVIAEAFLPGTEPGRERSTVEESTSKDPFAVPRGARGSASPSAAGIY
jgi:penicillin-binding protein 1A